ncbi:MAG: 3-isopropylmalate dehydratase large subunit [Candidatus Freyarchaeota archaeon]|nr:3-isopropylmalate dehydratase large subunit [Candidatus Jordarchaeia archaeon]
MKSLTSQILARAAGREKVEVGELIVVKVDKVMIHDVTGLIVLDVIESLKVDEIIDPNRLYIFLDHYSPPPHIDAANIHKRLRDFASKFKIKNFAEINEGICHQVMCEGPVRPSEIIVGADSHTTTYGALASFSTGVGSSEATYALVTGELWFKVPEPFYIELEGTLPNHASGKDVILDILSKIGVDGALYKAMEFSGSGLKSLKMADRLTICNMCVEGGAKNAIFPLDEVTTKYFDELNINLNLKRLEYLKRIDPRNPDMRINLNLIEPMVAKPPSPADAIPVSYVEGINIDVGFIGSCTGGRYEDLFIAAKILKGRKVFSGTRLIVIPASKRVYKRALENGLIKIFCDAGAIVGPPSCGPCFGGHLGVVGDNEAVITSSNRNFKGRMGSLNASIYLASSATVAASTINGVITDPRKYLRR